MNIKLLYSCLLIAGTMGTVYAQETVDTAMVRKIREEGLNHSKVMETAFYLIDVSGPRISGSPELKHAQDWAVNQLKSWGLVNAQREPWGKFGKGWEVQKNYAAITVPYYHAITAIPKAWTPGTNGPIKSDVVLIKADTITDLDKYKGTLQGKIVIFPICTGFDALMGRLMSILSVSRLQTIPERMRSSFELIHWLPSKILRKHSL